MNCSQYPFACISKLTFACVEWKSVVVCLEFSIISQHIILQLVWKHQHPLVSPFCCDFIFATARRVLPASVFWRKADGEHLQTSAAFEWTESVLLWRPCCFCQLCVTHHVNAGIHLLSLCFIYSTCMNKYYGWLSNTI